MPTEADDGASTAAVLAHGALNSFTAVRAAFELLAEAVTIDDALTLHLVDLGRSQMDTLIDSLRLIAMGMPSDALEQLDALDQARVDRHPPRAQQGAELAVGPRAESRAETRRLVQQATLRLAEDQGFDTTSVSDIAAASYISTRTFFRHFESKQEAIWSWFEDEMQTLAGAVASAPTPLADRDALRFGVRAYAVDVSSREDVAARYIALLAESTSLGRLGLEQTAGSTVSDALRSRASLGNASIEQRVLARIAAAAVAAAMEEFHASKGEIQPLSELIITALETALPAPE